jgi:metal-sulfur cluster biosynthetic enzyme
VTDTTPTSTVAPESTVKPEDVIEVLRECFDPEIPVNIVDLGLIYDIAIKPERVDVKMTLTALGCPMAADVMADVRDHLLTLPGIKDAGVDIVYEPVWTPERMSEEARWELGMVSPELDSGRVRPHVVDSRDDRLGLGAVLQVVDIGLSIERVERRPGPAPIRRHAGALALIPDVTGG